MAFLVLVLVEDGGLFKCSKGFPNSYKDAKSHTRRVMNDCEEQG